MLEFLRVEIISYSPATDTIGDSVFYVEADGGSYISDYLNTYSYGNSSPHLDDNFEIYAWHVTDGGIVYYNYDVHMDSYGSKIYSNLD